jgi:hypothetical protein
MSASKEKAIQDMNAAKSLMTSAISKASKAISDVRAVKTLAGGRKRRRTGKKSKGKK